MRIVSNTWPILSGEMNYTSGLYGTLLSGIFASMFDYSGAFLISAIMGLIGIILLTYYWFANLDRDTIKEKLKKPRPQREIRNEIPISYEQPKHALSLLT